MATIDELIQYVRRGAKARDELIVLANGRVSQQLKGKVYPWLSGRFSESDVSQEAMAKVFRNLDDFEGNTEAEFWAWVVETVENTLRDLVKRETAEKRNPSKEIRIDATIPAVNGSAPPVVSSDSTPSQSVVRHETEERMNAAIAKLSPDHRVVVNLRLREVDFDEIGRIMDRSGAAARKLYDRALDELKEILNERG